MTEASGIPLLTTHTSSVHINGILTPHGYVINDGKTVSGGSGSDLVTGVNGHGNSYGSNGISRSTSSNLIYDSIDEPLRDDPDDAAFKYHERKALRHGFEDVYNSEFYMSLLAQNFYIYFDDKRHETAGNPKPFEEQDANLPDWRMKDRQKTISAAIVLCLNLGVDPPDVVKTEPCAKLEAWVDPTEHQDSKKATELIAKNLQAQYETLSMRTRYKQSLDPNVEDAKRFCIALRRGAKDERILFHYNGHGVPKPTVSGEIWVFNKGYTQYIPVSIYDLQSWLGAPCLFVYDCHAAGNIVANFNRFVDKRIADDLKARDGPASSTVPGVLYRECIQLAACQANECLPMNPDLPMDLFTCCLTSPIEIAIRWFILQSPLPRSSVLNLDVTIPGRLADRRTPLGELNWIFTAITDTIAWSQLEAPLFKKLFRQDLMVAALFRNFLLAERIMRVHNCHPISEPKLPATHNHPMWESWDLAVDQCLAQLPMLEAAENGGPAYEYKHSTFFEEQLTAFEIWLKYGSKTKRPPEQLPVVLQVLLSQVHRLRALILLSRFLDLGPWAVYLALSIGIFPYVLKLLQSPAQELRPVLVFIWARIMSVDYQNIQQELLKDNSCGYFIHILTAREGLPTGAENIGEHHAMCAFIIALFCRGNKNAQRACMGPDVMQACLMHIQDLDCALLRQWACLCISQLWDNNAEAKWMGVREDAPAKLAVLLDDPVPEVRTAVLVALSTFLEITENENALDIYNEEIENRECQIIFAALRLTGDGSGMVRKEIVVLFSRFVKHYASKFLVIAFKQLEQDHEAYNKSGSTSSSIVSLDFPRASIFIGVWKALLVLATDPFVEVGDMAADVVDYVYLLLLQSPLARQAEDVIESLQRCSSSVQKFVRHPLSSSSSSSLYASPEPADTASISSGNHFALNARPPAVNRQVSSTSVLASTMKRSVSIAASLRNLALGYSEPAIEPITQPNLPPQNIGGTSVSTMPYGAGIHPDTARYHRRRPQDSVLMPLNSGFFEWSCEYFQEPQMSQPEMDEPGSVDYNQRLWRRTRNEKTLAYTQPQKELAAVAPWNTQIGFLNNATQPTKLVFAQFEPHLIAVDDRDGVTIWNWPENQKLNRFCNANPPGTKITEAKLINEDDVPLLMTGAGDGVIRLYRNYESEDNIELVCAWRALTDMLPSNKSSGLVADWQQGRGTMIVGGDVKVIRLWDAPRELCMADIPARSGSPITSLTSDQVAGHILIAGFGDGALRVYDRRLDPREAMVKVWKYHKSWVLNVHMQRGGARELASGSVDGKIHIWDLRMDTPVLSFQAHERGMRAVQVHEHAPILATGSQMVKLWRLSGEHTAVVKTGVGSTGGASSYMTLAAPPIRPHYVSALCFHPHRMVMAVNNSHDSHVGVYNCVPNLVHDFS
ncbi:raptor N-terminal caspase like domain-containing protein [Lipomyces japonicus]|uniref:raptor N-terminal caspase like domain-containing protein n=1 Tax=Lipomyces japonicus TaxID=56871 RepID=UPI0034CD0CF3